jgi:AraC-like DNA-binding protein
MRQASRYTDFTQVRTPLRWLNREMWTWWRANELVDQGEAVSFRLMDPLSDLLRMVRLDGAYFYCVEAAEPWSVSTRTARELAPRIMPGSDHLIPYHILTAGRCFVGVLGEDQIEMVAGDVIAFPHGDGHVLSSARGFRLGGDAIPGYPEHYPHAMTIGTGRSPSASFVCGFLGCDLRPFNPLLAALPRRLHMPAMSDGWLDGFTRRLTEEVRLGRAGADGVLTRLAELMFLDLLRRHLEKLPAGQTGWLAGLRDEIVGRLLAVLHARPGHPWTLDELAREAGSSRSNVAKRFTDLVGQPPMQYLAQWRMQVAANRLTGTTAKLAAIAAEVGYESEAAFSRAFKRATGLSPGAWREARRLHS